MEQKSENDLCGSRIAFLTPNDASYVVSKWATWLCDATAVPLCTKHPAEELEYVISDSQSKLVVLHPAFKDVSNPLEYSWIP